MATSDAYQMLRHRINQDRHEPHDHLVTKTTYIYTITATALENLNYNDARRHRNQEVVVDLRLFILEA